MSENYNQDNSFVQDNESTVLKLGPFMVERMTILNTIASIENDFGRSSREYSLAMEKLKANHAEFSSYLEKIRLNKALFRYFEMSDDYSSIPISNYILVHGETKYDVVLEQLFITLYEESYVRTIDEFTEKIDDVELKRKLIEMKYLSFLLNPELEGMYLGVDTIIEKDKWSIEKLLTGEKAKKYTCEHMEVERKKYQESETVEDKSISALRLVALIPFLGKDDAFMILDETKETLNGISSNVTKLMYERETRNYTRIEAAE